MAKITAADVEKDIQNVNIRLQGLDYLINKNENEYLTKKSLLKTNEGILKTIKKSIQREEDEYNNQIQDNEETAVQKVNRKRIEENRKEQQRNVDSKVDRLILQSIMGVGAGGLLASQIQETVTGSKPDGTNGRLKADQLKDVGDGFKLWTPAADAYLEMKAAAAKDKVYFKLSSAYRTVEEQQALVDELGTWSPTNPGAAPPGTSAHGWGIAIDISSPGAQQWINRYGAKYGWVPTVSNEPWHFEWRGGQPKAEPVSNTNVQKISQTPTKTSAGLISFNTPQAPEPSYPLLQPEIASAASKPINKPRPNPFFIVPTG